MITNRERFLARALLRNSYEYSEAKIDKLIADEIGDTDVDAVHAKRMVEDRLQEEEEKKRRDPIV